MTTPVPEKKRNGCLIAVVIVFVLILAALLLSGKQVRKLWDLGKEVFALQAEIETAFELQDVGVHWRVSGDLSTLDVEVDAQALGDKTDADREALAGAQHLWPRGLLVDIVALAFTKSRPASGCADAVAAFLHQQGFIAADEIEGAQWPLQVLWQLLQP